MRRGARYESRLRVNFRSTGLILPLGDQPFEIQRLPWLTLTLAALCVVVALAVPPEPAEQPPDLAVLEGEAADYWSRHAYLIASQALLDAVEPELSSSGRAARLAELREASYRHWPSDENVRREQQDRLDELAAIARAAALVVPDPGPGFVPERAELRALLTYPFQHASVSALLASLLGLLVLGSVLEAAWHRAVYGAFLAVSCLFAVAFYWGMVPDSSRPLLGAGPLLSALAVACLRVHWTDGCRFTWFFWSGQPVSGSFVAPAWSFALVWLAAEGIRIGLAEAPAELPYQADVGALIVGAVAAQLLRQPQAAPGSRPATRVAKRPKQAKQAETAEDVIGSLFEQAQRERMRGDIPAAFTLLQQAVRQGRGDRDTVLEFWEVAQQVGRVDAACPAMLGLVRACVSRGELAPAARAWLEVTARMPNVRLDPETLVRLAPALVALQRNDAAREALKRAIASADENLSGEGAARAARLARDLGDETTASAAARRAVASEDLPEDEKAILRALSGESAKPAVRPPSAPVEPAAEPAAAPPPPQPDPDPEPDSEPLLVEVEPVTVDAISSETVARFSAVKVIEGVPELLGEHALSVRVSQERLVEVEYARVQALSAVRIMRDGEPPIVLIDLIMNWNDSSGGPLHLVRLRGDRFDPHQLVGDGISLSVAYRVLLTELHGSTGAVPLPAPEILTGEVPNFPTLEDYQREVLSVDPS